MAKRSSKAHMLRAAVVGILALAGVLAAAPVPTALPNLPPSYDASTLVATPAPSTPALDGVPDAAWAAATPVDIPAFGGSGSFPSGSGIKVRAMYDATTLYLLATWADSTEDYSQAAWLLSDNATAGGVWTRTDWGDDGLAFIWDDGQGLDQNFSQAGCGPLCHTGTTVEMRTAAGTLDAWHWSSSFTLPLHYADDMYMDGASKANGSATGGFHNDGADPRNNNTVTTSYGERPAFLNATVPLTQSARTIALADQTPINWLSFNSTSMPKGLTVPGSVLTTPQPGQRDVAAGAAWNGTGWSVEMARPLVTADNSSRDLAFDDLNATYYFSLSVFDNKTGQNHSSAGFGYKLIFAENVLPDLTPEAVTPQLPATLIGDPVNLTVRVRNNGFGDANGPSLVTITDAVSLAEVANVSAPAIAWRDFYLANLSFSSLGYTVGVHNFTAKVDAGGAVPESFENNNTRAFQITFITTTALSDLIVTNMTGPAGVIFAGDTLRVNGTVGNIGAGDTVNDVVVQAGHPLFGNQTQNLGPMLAGEAANFSLTFTAGAVPAGSYAITAIADFPNQVDEDSEANNSAIFVVTVEDRPDLVPIDITADPAAGVGGAALVVNLTIENRAAAFNDTVDVWVYLDNSTSITLANRTDVWGVDADLSRGENITISNLWVIPPSLAPGEHRLRVWVDGSRATSEYVETNNNATVVIFVIRPPRPDLEVSALTVANASYRPGEQASISVNITNNGVAYLGSVRLQVTEATLNRSLGSLVVPAVPPGATITIAADFAIPSGSPGVHSILVIVDADGVLDEDAELNNALSVAYTLLNPRAADPFILALGYSPSEPTAGDIVTVNVTVRNGGNLDSAPGNIALAWVANALGSSPVPALGPGQSANVSFFWNTAGLRTLSAILSLTLDNAGGTDVNVSNNAQTFVVTFRQAGLPSIHMTNLAVTPASVHAGDSVRIEVRVTNNGTAPGNATVRFYAGTVALPPVNITVGVGETQVVNVTWIAAGVGAVNIRAELQSGGTTVTALGSSATVAPAIDAPGSPLVLILVLAIVAAVALVLFQTVRKRGGDVVDEPTEPKE